MTDISALEAALVMLAPTAVLMLVGQQKAACLLDGGCIGGDACGAQSPYAKPRPVGKTNRPRAFPTAVLALFLTQELFAALDGAFDLSCKKTGKALFGCLECLETGRCTLCVRIIDHDLTEGLRRVKAFDPCARALSFVRSPSTVIILEREDQADTIAQQIFGDRVMDLCFEGNGGFEPFGGAVRDRPTMKPITERPTASACVAKITIFFGHIFEHLVVFDVVCMRGRGHLGRWGFQQAGWLGWLGR